MKLTVKGSMLMVGEDLLVYRYPMGDVDLIPWPKSEDLLEWQGQLAQALFDAREMGYWDGDHVELPNGELFYPDKHLDDYTPPSTEGWFY